MGVAAIIFLLLVIAIAVGGGPIIAGTVTIVALGAFLLWSIMEDHTFFYLWGGAMALLALMLIGAAILKRWRGKSRAAE